MSIPPIRSWFIDSIILLETLYLDCHENSLRSFSRNDGVECDFLDCFVALRAPSNDDKMDYFARICDSPRNANQAHESPNLTMTNLSRIHSGFTLDFKAHYCQI